MWYVVKSCFSQHRRQKEGKERELVAKKPEEENETKLICSTKAKCIPTCCGSRGSQSAAGRFTMADHVRGNGTNRKMYKSIKHFWRDECAHLSLACVCILCTTCTAFGSIRFYLLHPNMKVGKANRLLLFASISMATTKCWQSFIVVQRFRAPLDTEFHRKGKQIARFIKLTTD